MLSKFSVKKPLTILVAVIIVLVFGVVSYIKMTPDLFPNIDAPVVVCMTPYPGASPEEAETEITKPMEQQLATLANLEQINSVSGDNFSLVSMVFTDGVNMDTVSIDIREKIDQIESVLPETAGTPLVMKMSMDMMPTVIASVNKGDMTSGEISKLVEDDLMTELKGIEGVASVSTMGLVDSNIQVVLSQDKIDAVNKRVTNQIKKEFNKASGKVKKGIKKAKNGRTQIADGMVALDAAHDSGAKKLEETKSQLQKGKEQLNDQLKPLDMLLKTYDSIKDDPTREEELLEVLKAIQDLGFDPDTLRTTVDGMNQQMKSIENALVNIGTQEANMTYTLGTKYADLSAAEATVTSAIGQLQGTLKEIQAQNKAAVDGADMSNVITMANISAILTAQNFSMPAGYVTDDKAEILVSVGDKITDKDELDQLILFDLGIDGIDPIRVCDVATVTYGSGDSPTYAKINGKNGVCLTLTKQSTYATATVADNIDEEFRALEEKYDGLEFTYLYNGGDYIHMVINSVLRNLLLGAILAMLILVFFLRDIRPTIITAVSIPLSVIFAVVLMYFSGVTLNMISLSGLAIGIGMLVDNSIVVIENIFRLRSLGYSRIQSAISGAVQMGGAITASTLTTICVFVPIIFIDGTTRDIFQDLALTVAYSLFASLLIALTVVPAMAKSLLKGDGSKAMLKADGRVVRGYKKAATWAIGHKVITIVLAVVILVASSGLALTRGFEFMPSMATPQISANLTMPDESTIEDTTKTCDAVSAELVKIDGVEDVGIMLASNQLSMFGMGGLSDDVTKVSMYIIMDEDKLDNVKKVSKTLEEMSKKYNCEIETSADMDMSTMMGGSDVSMTLYSEDLDDLRIAGVDIEEELSSMKSLENVSNVNEDSTDELHIVVNKNKAMQEGLTVAQVYQQIAAKLSKESTATTLTKGGSDTDVVIENSTKNNFDRNDLEKMELVATNQKTGETSKVKLKDIAAINKDKSLGQIRHSGQKRSLTVTASVVDGYNVTKVTSQIKENIKSKDLVPNGVEIEYEGQNKEIMHSMKQMLEMLAVGFLLIYLIMVAQFQSLRSPLIVIFTVPLAFTGGMLALVITGNPLSVIGMMGFVMLDGIVVNNAIVLVDTINRFRLNGMAMDEAIINSGAIRMRPVIMTAMTTVLGLVPLALGLGNGAEMVAPVAIVTIGGLIYATLTT
ncbi:MAG: efflux RND transporter permease subunit, partial [Eubacterium sp.]|nr:efflux RND transporter permease subunit [Candidatus Colimonas fimequi]